MGRVKQLLKRVNLGSSTFPMNMQSEKEGLNMNKKLDAATAERSLILGSRHSDYGVGY